MNRSMNAMDVGLPTGEIEIVVNGDAATLRHGASVADLVSLRGLAGQRFAVELDGEIVPRSRHAATVIAPGAHVEIVVAVGGG